MIVRSFKQSNKNTCTFEKPKAIPVAVWDLTAFLFLENFLLLLKNFSDIEIFMVIFISAFFMLFSIFIHLKSKNIPKVNNF